MLGHISTTMTKMIYKISKTWQSPSNSISWASISVTKNSLKLRMQTVRNYGYGSFLYDTKSMPFVYSLCNTECGVTNIKWHRCWVGELKGREQGRDIVEINIFKSQRSKAIHCYMNRMRFFMFPNNPQYTWIVSHHPLVYIKQMPMEEDKPLDELVQ